jgi:methylenetetrahydrofolate dehydrogenase (NADP+)/methenyltetrahydrofolate cyclohydrolase
MLADCAAGIPEGHFPAAEIHQEGAAGDMGGVKGRFAQRGLRICSGHAFPFRVKNYGWFMAKGLRPALKKIKFSVLGAGPEEERRLVSHEGETRMPAEIIDGILMREAILAELRGEVALLREQFAVVPGLVTILAGEDPSSASYVAQKAKTALDLGFFALQEKLPEDVPEAALLELILRYNADERIHGILVQLPLPGAVSEERVIAALDPAKDVDGFHPANLGRLLAGGQEEGFLPCTPAGIREMLLRLGVETDGADIVVVGRSVIVGKPVAVILGQRGRGGDGTVTLAHSRTRDLAGHCRRADILVVAVGRHAFVRADWIKPGATVIDVGVNRVGFNESTGRAILRGDVDFDKAREVAGRITPVPGGVGPLTIAMLMKNTLEAAKRACRRRLLPGKAGLLA